jgi:CRISPR/Cas system-associated endonuclease Cas1
MSSYKMSRSKRRTIPNWKSIQAGEDAGVLLIDLWRKYATAAPLPYHITTFRKEFRKWQSTAPVKRVEEYAASDAYWQGKAAVRPDILTLDDGATLRVRGGALEVFNHGETTHFPPGSHHRKPKAIIFSGWGGSFSIEAARFCLSHHITVIATGWLGDLLTFIAPRPIQDAALVRFQCSFVSDKTAGRRPFVSPVPIARAVILQKFLHYRATGRLSPNQFKSYAARLSSCKTLASILNMEALGSSEAWVVWSGLSLTPRTGRTLPPWLAKPFRHRSSGLGASGARHATDPINAMLNLAYAKEAGRLGALLAASGACLAIGFLHCDKPHRHSLVFDALEPLRPLIDAKVYAFIKSNTFDRGDFLRLSSGHVRMVPSLIKTLLEKTALPSTDLVQAVRFMLFLVSAGRRRFFHNSERPPRSVNGRPLIGRTEP